MKIGDILPWVVLAIGAVITFGWLRGRGDGGGGGSEGSGGSGILQTGFGLPSPNLMVVPLYPGGQPKVLDTSDPMITLAKSQAGPGVETFTTFLQRLFINTPQVPSSSNFGIINNPVPFGATIGASGQVSVGGKQVGTTVQGVPPNAVDFVESYQSPPLTQVGYFQGKPTYAMLGGGGGSQQNAVDYVVAGKSTSTTFFPQAATLGAGRGGTISYGSVVSASERAMTEAKYRARGWI